MNKHTLSRLFKDLKPYYGFIVLSCILAIAYALMTLYIPILVGNAIDKIIGVNEVDFASLGTIFIKIIIILIIASLVQYLMTIINNYITFKFTRDLRNRTFNKIQHLPVAYLDNHPSGDIISRMVNDIDSLSEGLLLGFSTVFTGVVSIVVTLVYMFILNYIMAIVVFFLTPLSLVVAKFIANKIRVHFRRQSVLKGEQTAYINEMVDAQKIVRAFGHEKADEKQFDEIASRLEDASLKANFFSSLVNPTTRFVNALVYAAITLVGSLVALSNPLFTCGMLTTFLSYASQYTKPFNDISSVVSELQNSLTCLDRVYELLNEPSQSDDTYLTELKDIKGNIDIDDISFSYEEEQHLIENFSLSVKAGQRVAIVGPTGCGKTTLINLLMRFYDVQSGHIDIDKHDVKTLKRSSIYQAYGNVLQDSYLRNTTVLENITMGVETPFEEVKRAAILSHCDDFICKMSEGYNTVLDENGGAISQGQKQLICIARIMLNIPPMLILDEATSSLDTRTELLVQDAFNTLMKGRTSFIVAHRLSTIKEADVIIVMNKGHIVEKGKHDELLAKKGFYYNLYNSQFAK